MEMRWYYCAIVWIFGTNFGRWAIWVAETMILLCILYGLLIFKVKWWNDAILTYNKTHIVYEWEMMLFAHWNWIISSYKKLFKLRSHGKPNKKFEYNGVKKIIIDNNAEIAPQFLLQWMPIVFLKISMGFTICTTASNINDTHIVCTHTHTHIHTIQRTHHHKFQYSQRICFTCPTQMTNNYIVNIHLIRFTCRYVSV